jgi:hypothetical protein
MPAHRLSRTTALLLATAAAAGAPAALAVTSSRSAAPASGPTQKQIRAAVAKATHSGHLWATINACAPTGHPHLLGVRGQMPALGFPARLAMVIQIEYWDTTKKRFLPDPGIAFRNRLGIVTAGYEQGGHNFFFKPHAGKLRATITFLWHRNGALLGSATRPTTTGHHDADFARPAGYSAATCTLK